MKNIVKTSWRDVTINEYFDFRDKLESASSDYEKEIIKIAFVNGFNEDDVWNMTISDVKRYQQNTYWLNDFEISKDVKFTSINPDMQNFSVAQYIDFQNFFPKRTQKTNYIGNILACFIVPKGKKYGEGYDVAQLVNKINDNVDILTSNEIIFFFLKRYLFSIKVMLIFFKYQMKILKLIGKKKNKEKIKKIEEKVKELEQNISVGLLSLITSPN